MAVMASIIFSENYSGVFSKVESYSGVSQIAKNCSGIYPVNPYFYHVSNNVTIYTAGIIGYYKTGHHAALTP
jgi:hypothetical protein